MNYQLIYQNLINKNKKENRKKGFGIYYERHHIIPKCLNGTNEKENLVLLTAKEHFIAHKLLTYIYPNNRNIITAFHLMTYGTKKPIKINISSRDYLYARELLHQSNLSEETKLKIKNYKHTQEAKDKISKALKGKPKTKSHCEAIKNANLNKKRPKWMCKKMSESRKQLFKNGYISKITNETKTKISNSLKGEKNPNFGKPANNSLKIQINNINYDNIKIACQKLNMTHYQIYYRLYNKKYDNFKIIV